MDQSPQLQQFDSERLVQWLRRWAVLVATAAVLAGAMALVVSKLIASEYDAIAQLYLAPASTSTVALQDVILGQSLAKSYVQLATAEIVLRKAMDQVGWAEDLKAFRTRANVAQVRDTSVITVSFRSTDPQRAAETANAIAEAFISQSRALQTSLQGSTALELEQQIRAVQDDIKSLDQQITSLRTQLTASPKPGESPAARIDVQAEILRLDASRQSKQQTLAQLLKTRDDMRLAQARAETTVTLWQPATAPEEPVSPRPLLNTLLGAVTGALVAIATIAFIGYVYDRLTALDDVQERLGTAPLGLVPLHAHPETITGKLFVRDEPRAAEAEAIRVIRTNVLFAGVDRRPRSLLVTSAVPGEGKSVLSANLALAFAEAGTPVVLIDGDLRRPSQHRLFRVSASVGLTTLLTDNVAPGQFQQFRVSPQLLVIPSGPLPPNPAELLASGRMSALIHQLSALAENGIVIVDSSPVLVVADPLALATKVDACILVIDASRTRVASARRALAALERVHAPTIGAVLNKLLQSDAAYQRYGGYYGVRRLDRAKAGEARRT